MQEQATGTDNPILNGLRSFSQNGSAVGNAVGLGLALTGQSQGPYAGPTSTPEDIATSKGMDMLAAEMSHNGGDPAKAMIKMTQDKQFQRLMATPGTFKRITDNFRGMLTNPAPTSTPAGPGTDVTQNGQPVNLQGRPGYTPPLPQQTNTPEGSTTQTTQVAPGQRGAQQTGSFSQPTSAAQTFDNMVKKYAGNWDSGVISQIAMASVAQGDPAKKLASLQGLVQRGIIGPDVAQKIANGAQVIPDPNGVPGRFYTIDPFGQQMTGPDGQTHWLPSVTMQQLGAFNTGPSLNPSYMGGNEAPTGAFGSSPDVQKGQAPGPQGNAQPGGVPLAGLNPPGPGATQQLAPQANEVAAKYHVPPESVQSDGTLDVQKAYGAPAQMVLGAGMPAIVQNDLLHIKQWLDPSAPKANEESVRQAEIFGDNMRVMSDRVALASSGRLTGLMESMRATNPEHEKWNDPGYAIDQLTALRSTISNIAQGNAQEQRQILNNGTKSESDQKRLSEMRDENTKIQQMLAFLPSDGALKSMKQAFNDGLIKAPTAGSVARTAGGVAKDLARDTVKSLFPGKVDKWNADIGGTVAKIQAATSLDQLTPLARNFSQLDPRLQRAFEVQRARLKGQGQAQAKPQGPNTFQGAPVRNVTPRQSNPLNPLGAIQ